MASTNALFRRLRRLADAYLDDLSIGELEDLTEHLRKTIRTRPTAGYQPLLSDLPPKPPPVRP